MSMTKKRKTGIIILSVILALILALTITCLVLIDNKSMDFENFEIAVGDSNTEKVTVKIAQLSDLHFPKCGVDTEKLINRLNEEKVDIITITGDIIDGRERIEGSGLEEFIGKLKFIAPIYYVNGNHEVYHKDRKALYKFLKESGVVFLANESEDIVINGKGITIIGLLDDESYTQGFLNSVDMASKNYRILLAHHPEKWERYLPENENITPNLILTGHAHGGQVRIFGKGLYAPDQGWFPKYDNGLYLIGDSGNINMIVSRGIGNSVIKYRFNNKPHIPIISVSI